MVKLAMKHAAGLLAMLALAGCAAMIEEASRPQPVIAAPVGPVSLMPWLSIEGGRVGARLDASGAVVPMAGSVSLRFVRPVAIALQGPWLTVADAALGQSFRLDPAAGVVAVATLPAPLAVEGLRLAGAPDGSLLAVDGVRSQVARFGAGGRPLASLDAPGDLGRPVDVAVSAFDGRIAVADGLQSQLLLFNPLGRAYVVIGLATTAQGGPVAGLRSVAIGQSALYASAASCGCVIEIALDGGARRVIGAPVLERPGALAVDHAGRLYVAEPEAGRLSVVVDGQAIQRFTLRQLGVRAIADIKAVDGALYLADPLSGRVEARRILARAPGSTR